MALDTFDIKQISPDKILSILPLLKELNNYTTEEILIERIKDMNSQAHYKCVGVYFEDNLIGISGLWHLTRHYCGKTVEPDHVIISSEFRGQGIGKKLFEWIHNYTQQIGYEATELNTYIKNTKSHTFYENEGYNRLGYHFIKIL